MIATLLEQDLAYLTSPTAAGRLSGSEGARKIAAYLQGQLAAVGFETTLQTVHVPAARLTGLPRLVIANRAFTARQDFAEHAAFSSGGQVTGSLLVVQAEDQLAPASLKGRVVLIPERPQGFDLAETIKSAVEFGVAALLVENGEPDWFYKTVFSGSGQIPVVRIKKSIAMQLAQMDGASVEIDLPLQNETLPCRNVLGLIRNPSNPFTLALTAHYDHLGDDPGGVRFPGAFDNASGVAAILAVARRLAAEPLAINLLIAFLTGEESGLWGARQLIAQPPAPLSAVINLDGIGSESRLNAMRLGHSQRSNWLAALGESVLLQRGIQVQWISGSDDSSAFITQGKPTLGLGQQSTGQAQSVIHTPLDTLEALHLETIQEGVEALLAIVQSIAHLQYKENNYVYTK